MKNVLLLMVAWCAGCDDAERNDAGPAFTDASLVAASLGPNDIRSEFPPDDDQWHLSFHRLAKGLPVHVAVAIRLGSDGRLSLRTEHGWKPTTLRQIRTQMAATNKRLYALRENKDRRPSHFVGVETVPNARWEHVLWILSQCEWSGARNLQIRIPGRTFRLYLRANGIACGGEGRPLEAVEVSAFTRAGGDRFRVDGQPFEGLPKLRGLLERKRKEAVTAIEFMTVYFAEREATLGQVLDAFDMLIDAGLPNVEFWAFDEEEIEEDGSDIAVERKDEEFRVARVGPPKRYEDLAKLPLGEAATPPNAGTSGVR